MYTPRGRGRGARPRAATSRLASAASSPAWLGEIVSGSGGVGQPSAASCSTSALDPRRVGLLVDPVEGRDLALLAAARRPARW